MSHKRSTAWLHYAVAGISRTLLLFVLAIFLFPLLWMVDTAVKPNIQVFQFPPSLIPWTIMWGNFEEAWNFVPFGRYVFNDVVISTIGTLVVLVTSSMAAFAFSRLRFRGRDSIFLLYVGTLAVPQAVLVIPEFLIMKQIGWVDSYQGVIFPLAFTAFGTFLLRQFFRGLPTELDDAALIDGCSRWGILVRIIVPLSRPALGVLGLFTFVGYWNNFLWPLIILQSPEMSTVPLGLYQFHGQFAIEFNYQMAGCAISMAPGIVLVILLQRYLTEGISITGLGGR
jgi:multiple sugar transport system permease protein